MTRNFFIFELLEFDIYEIQPRGILDLQSHKLFRILNHLGFQSTLDLYRLSSWLHKINDADQKT